MSKVTAFLSMALNFSGMIRLRQSLADNFAKLDDWIKDSATPLVVADTTTAITLTAAAHFTGAEGHIVKEATLYTTNASAIAAGMTKTESDKLAIGTKLNIVMGTGAVTITGSGGVTFTARGVVAGGRIATAHKVSAALWYVQYPALSS